jgi:hypothetical protein
VASIWSGSVSSDDTMYDSSSLLDLLNVPRIWRYLDALPVNVQGKTTHSAL